MHELRFVAFCSFDDRDSYLEKTGAPTQLDFIIEPTQRGVPVIVNLTRPPAVRTRYDFQCKSLRTI